ncbi:MULTISPECIES: hypothetical protein [unclassified Streptomyces]|uniref:hypothetical protein n=1 Tax=unclassified Streptomyces TaxID=2593676 RepID=UPI00403CB664
MGREDVVFACQRDGLTRTLDRGLLGGYDGAGAWRAELPEFQGPEEQLMVENHEGLHHELQASSPWGRLTAHASLVSRAGFRRGVLGEIFDVMVEGCRQTHECFATTLSASVLGVARTRALLAHNTRYHGYLAHGLSLVEGDDIPWQFRETAASMVLRCCMAPRSVFTMLDKGYERLGVRDLVEEDQPDHRLAAFTRVGGPSSWAPLFESIVGEHPERGGDRGGPDVRQSPEDEDQLERLRSFEEDVLVKLFYEHCTSVLDAAGLPSVSWADLPSLPDVHIATVNRVSPELASVMRSVTGRRPMEQDTLEYDRQGAGLRNRLPVELLPAHETSAFSEAFEVADQDGDRCAVGVWLDRAAAVRQFDFPCPESLPDPVIALLVPARAAAGEPVVRIGLLPSDTTPLTCQQGLKGAALVVLATQSVLIDPLPGVQQALMSVEPVHVLMDLPVLPHLRHWCEQGVTVRWALIPLQGAGAQLSLAAFEVEAAPGMVFLHIGTRLAVGWTIQNVLADGSGRLVHDPALLGRAQAELGLVVGTVLSAWSILDQAGGEGQLEQHRR